MRSTRRRGIDSFVVATTLALFVALLVPSTTAVSQESARDGPRQLLDGWVELWAIYDLDRLPGLFLQDERLTDFSSETEGLLRGYDRIVEHHRGFGFEPGGTPDPAHDSARCVKCAGASRW